MLLLQEYEFEIQHRLGTHHAIVDYVSRISKGNEAIAGHNDFSDAEILRITTIGAKDDKHFPDRWLMEMTYFLSTELPPPQLRTDEKKRLAVRSWNFCLDEGVLYHKGSDDI